jgi:hypothetical protein
MHFKVAGALYQNSCVSTLAKQDPAVIIPTYDDDCSDVSIVGVVVGVLVV